MTSIDLRQYVAGPTGTWFNDAANFQPNLLRLSSAEDGLTLVGPLRVKVCVLAQNRFTRASGETSTFQTRDVYSYTLQLGPGDVWSYPEPRSKLVAASEKARALSASSVEAGATGPADLAFVLSQYLRERPLIGANAGTVLLIRPAGNELCGDPCASSSPCREDPCAVQTGCGCGGKCGCGGGCGGSCGCAGGCANNSDLPCDFAVRGQNVAAFFPAACEPCAPGAPVSMPPTKGPALSVSPAAGGTIRTRFYTGMHMTKEDFETDQKNARIKRALSNRALGQGVAWGFSLGLDGDGVCVTPGYGLDCCGNDIVLTSAYRVDAAALVADPAAAQIVAKRGPQRLALVLEYFECPQDVRPVHGDPCTLDGARCEPSRIRETVRLRLAPPCDVDDSGPIKDFLAELEKLRADPAVAPYFAHATAAAEQGCGDSALTNATLSALPFHVQLEIVPPNQSSLRVGPPTAALPVPAAGSSDAQGDTYVLGDGEGPSAGYRARITVTLQGGFSFTHSGAPTPIDVTTRQPAGSAFALDAPRTNATQVVWDVPWEPKPLAIPSGADPIPPQYIHRFAGWQITGSSGSYTGSLDIQYTNVRTKQWLDTPWGKQAQRSAESQFPRNAVLVTHLDVPPGQSAGEGKRTFPCFGAPCNPGDTRFWQTFPWLHASPQNPNQAADWRVLLLAILYASLAGRMQESSYGTANYKKSSSLDTASAAYAAASKLFFAVMPDTDRVSVSEALQKLLQAWCKGLLYPGPVCRCCPHGVVIGCAVVEGGSIVSVDPWGGRRWVVQYPLLSYWGQQFGLMPADAIASRLFGMICCFAGLAAPKFSVSTGDNIRTRALVSAPGIRPTEPTVGRGSAVQLGPGTLVVDEASAAAQRAALLGATRTETLGPLAFVTKVSALIGVAAGADAGTPLVDYAVTGFPELHFVAPDQGGAPSAAPVAPGAPAAAAAAARPFGQLVADEIAAQLGKSRVPRLLRPVAESLAFSLSASLPLALPTSLAAAFGAADIDTAGKALDRDPEQLLVSVLKGKHAGALSALLDKAEGQVRAAVTVAVESLALAAADKQVTERADLRDAAGASQFVKLLSDRLKGAKLDLPRAAVAAALAEAARG